MFKALNWMAQAVQQASASTVKPRETIFSEHWEHVANFYRTESHHQHSHVTVESTNIQYHLDSMIRYLHEEEQEQARQLMQTLKKPAHGRKNLPAGPNSPMKTAEGDLEDEQAAAVAASMLQAPPGPCLEYLLQNKLLETLVAWGKGDIPVGMRITVLRYLTNLTKGTSRPLLAENGVHAPLENILRAAIEIDMETAYQGTALGEATTALIVSVMFHLKKHPPLLPIFFVTATTRSAHPRFTLFTSLIPYIALQSKTGSSAREAAAICVAMSPMDPQLAEFLAGSKLCVELVTSLTMAYCQLPSGVDRIPNWTALASASNKKNLEDATFAESLENLLSQTELLDGMVSQAAPNLRETVLAQVREVFVEQLFSQAFLQSNEKNAIAATVYLTEMLRVMRDQELVGIFVSFLFGPELLEGPEKRVFRDDDHDEEGSREVQGRAAAAARKDISADPEKIYLMLVSRLLSMSESLNLATSQLFDTLLGTFSEQVYWTLALRNLHTEQAANLTGFTSPDIEDLEGIVEELFSLTSLMTKQAMIADHSTTSLASQEDQPHSVSAGEEEVADEDQNDYFLDAQDVHQGCLIAQTNWTRGAWVPPRAGTTQAQRGDGSESDVEGEVAAAASSAAERWDGVYIGAFLSALFGELRRLLELPYDKVLVITSIFSKLVHLPDSILHRFLLSPMIPPPEGHSFIHILKSLVKDARAKAAQYPDFHLAIDRLQHPGQTSPAVSQRTLSDGLLEEGWERVADPDLDPSKFAPVYFALREFLKEIAAIVLVKSQGASMRDLDLLGEMEEEAPF